MQCEHTERQITWQSMTATNRTPWRAAYASAVSGAVRTLATIVDSVPPRARRTTGIRGI